MKGFFILEETGRSFVRRFWINLLLILQFTICFFLLITMMTYYLTIGDSSQFATVSKVNGREWHMMRLELSDSLKEFAEIALAPDGLERVSGLYHELCSADSFDLISAQEWQNIYFETELMDGRFGRGNYEQLIGDCYGTIPHELCYVDVSMGESDIPSVVLKSAQLNWQAFEAFGLRTVQGEGLTEENTTLASADEAIPVVLGNDYLGYFSVGEEIRLALPTMAAEDWWYRAVIVGILEDSSIMPPYGGPESRPEETVNLDEMVVIGRGLEFLTLPEDLEVRAKISGGLYSDALNQSYMSPKNGAGYQSAVKEANDISKDYGIELFFTSVSFGMEMLLQESQTAMTILLILTAAMTAFTVFCLVSTCISRVRDNAPGYAVRMLNGAGLGDIIAPCLLEFAILLLPALSANFFILRRNMELTRNYAPMLVVFLLSAGVFCLAAAVIVKKIGGINIEELMRRKE